MQVRPYKLIGASERARLQQLLSDVADHWSRQWLMAAPGFALQCGPAKLAAQSIAGEWREYVGKEGSLAYIATPASSMRRFAELTFGAGVNHFDPSSTGPSLLLGGVFDRALADIVERLRAVPAAAQGEGGDTPLDAREAPPPPDAVRRGSGALSVQWPLGKAWLDLILSADLVRRLLGAQAGSNAARERPVRISDCIQTQRVSLQAWVGEVEIGLGLLQSLAPGDVIRFEASIHEPLRVTLSGTSTRVRAFLGSSAGRKALQLTSPS